MNIYKEKGYRDRDEYLEELCTQYDSESVMALSELLGPEEDFDGLISMLDDFSI